MAQSLSKVYVHIIFSTKNLVVKYISNQEDHHLKLSFQEAFRTFLKKYNVEYGERYVWN